MTDCFDPTSLRLLKDPHKIKRKKVLKKIGSHLEENQNKIEDIEPETFEKIVNCFNDESEVNRELSTNIVTNYLNHSFLAVERDIPVTYFNKLLPILMNRLGNEDVFETCEEIRVLQLTLLDFLMANVEKSTNEKERILTMWLSELIAILKKTCVDDYSEIRKLAHQNIKTLIKNISNTFHLMAEPLLNPVLKSLSHLHSKVRVSAIQTLGQIVMYGGKECLPDKIVSHLAQRVFDDHLAVREEVYKFAFMMMTEYKDRYSFWGHLMPLLLAGLHDENPETITLASNLWQKTGIAYEKENDEKLSEELNYQLQRPQSIVLDQIHNGFRHTYGCRDICAQQISRLLPGIRNDLQDTLLGSSRLMAAQLLTSLLVLAENNITQHFQLAYTGILLAISNLESISSRADKIVFSESFDQKTFGFLELSSKLLGVFVYDSDLFIRKSQEHLDKNAALIILSNIVEGRKSVVRQIDGEDQKDKDFITKIDELIMSDTVSRRTMINANAQLATLKLGAFTKNFDVILSIAGTTRSAEVQQFAENLLCDTEIFENGLETALLECDHIIENTLDQDTWIKNSVDLSIFKQLFQWIMCTKTPTLTETTYRFLIRQLNNESDTENRLQILIILSRLFTLVKSCEIPDQEIIENLFKPSLKWRAGRSQMAARSASCAALWSYAHLIKDFTYFEKNMMSEIISLLDDDEVDTRLIACQMVEKIIANAGLKDDNLTLDGFYHKIYVELVKRLDDVSDTVRATSLDIWKQMFSVILQKVQANTYDAESLYSAHWEFIFKSLLVHMDDPDEKFRNNVFQALLCGKDISPRILLKEVQLVKDKHNFGGLCQELEVILEENYDETNVNTRKKMSQPKYFKSFKTRFAAINVNARRSISITNEEISDNSSNLREALDEWREKCQTLDFDILYEKVYPLTRSYQLVIVHSNAIFQEILSIIDKDHKFNKDVVADDDDEVEVEISSENEDPQLENENIPNTTIKTKPHILPISMDAVTSIINSFAKDIQSDIQPYLKFLLTSYAKILKSKENYEKTHVVDGIMSSISTILVYVWRELVASEDKLLDLFETCCQEIFVKEMPRYIKDFCCESLAFLIRKCGTKLRQKLFGIYLVNQDNENRRSTINSIIEYSILMSSNSEELASLSARKNLLSRKKKQGSDIFTKLDSIKIWFHSSAHEILLDYFNIISDNKIQLEQSALDFLKELSQHKIKGAEKVLIPIINRDIRLLEHYFEYFEWSKSISGPVELIKLYNLQKKINVKIALTIFTKYFSSDQYSNYHQDKLEVYEMLKANQKSNLASLFEFFRDLFSNHEDYGIFQEIFVDDFCMEIDLENEENYQNFRALVNLIVPEVIDFDGDDDDDDETTTQLQKFTCNIKIAKIIQQNSDYETASKLNVKMVFTEKQLKNHKNFDIYQKLSLPAETFLDIYGNDWEIKTATDMILAKKMGLTDKNFKNNEQTQKMVYRYFSSFDRQAILSAINFLNFDKLSEIELDIQENLTLNNYNLQLQKIKRILKPENSDLPIEIKIRYLTSLYFINFSLIWREVDKILLEFVRYPEFYQIILEQIVENLILALDQGDSHSRDKEVKDNYNLHGVLDSLAIYGVSSYQHRVSIRRNKERNYNGKVDFFNLLVQIFKMLKNVPKLANDEKNLSIVFFRALISIFELIVKKKYESSKIQRIHKVSEVENDKQRTDGSEEEEFQNPEKSGQKNDDIIKTGIPYLKTIKAILPVITTCATNLAFNKMTPEDKSRMEKMENFIQSSLLRSSDYHLQELSLTALISLQKQNFENKNPLIEKTSQTLKNLCNAKKASDYKSNLLEMKALLDDLDEDKRRELNIKQVDLDQFWGILLNIFLGRLDDETYQKVIIGFLDNFKAVSWLKE